MARFQLSRGSVEATATDPETPAVRTQEPYSRRRQGARLPLPLLATHPSKSCCSLLCKAAPVSLQEPRVSPLASLPGSSQDMMYPEEKRRLRVVHRAFSPAALSRAPPCLEHSPALLTSASPMLSSACLLCPWPQARLAHLVLCASIPPDTSSSPAPSCSVEISCLIIQFSF